MKFDRTGQFLKAWGSYGDKPGQFDLPHTILIDKDERTFSMLIWFEYFRHVKRPGATSFALTAMSSVSTYCVSPPSRYTASVTIS